MATVIQEAAVLKSAIKKFFGSPAARCELERATQALSSGAQGAGSPAMRLDAVFQATTEIGNARPGMAALTASSPSGASSKPKQLTAAHGISKPLPGHKFPVLPGQAFIPNMVASTAFN